MLWRIYSIDHLWSSKREDILPGGNFTLYYKQTKKSVTGWIPSHHPDVLYSLEFDANKIKKILHIETTRKKGRPILERYTKNLSASKKKSYLTIAEYSRKSMALWTLSVMYPIFNMPFNIEKAFLKLTHDMTLICTRGHALALKSLIYNYEMAKNTINRGLVQMGEVPEGQHELSGGHRSLQSLIEWQCNTMWNTATLKCPNIVGIEKYKGKWADKYDITCSREISTIFTPENTTTTQGSPSTSYIPQGAVIIFRNTEDIYKWKCRVGHGTLCLFKKIYMDDKYKMLGVGDCQELVPVQKHVFIAYAHLWSIEEFLKLKTYNIETFTLIGRLDQYSKGRGQVFRDMVESENFKNTMCRHTGAECIQSIGHHGVEDVKKKYKIVQGFASHDVQVELDRIQLNGPYRIRTIRKRATLTSPRTQLFEEKFTLERGKNASVVNIRGFHGVKPEAGIFFCSENTTQFDVHVARTQCKQALYIVGEIPPMFNFIRRPPSKITINPFV